MVQSDTAFLLLLSNLKRICVAIYSAAVPTDSRWSVTYWDLHFSQAVLLDRYGAVVRFVVQVLSSPWCRVSEKHLIPASRMI